MAAPPPAPRVPADVLRGLCHDVGAAREAVALLRTAATSTQDLLRARLVLVAAMQAYVAALTANLDAMGYFPTTHAVFGAMADKDLGPMLVKIGPLVDRWYFTNLPTPRGETAAVLQQKWNALQMVAGGRRDVTSSLHADPMAALQAAVAAADPADRIVVFGSFYTVGGVLINGTPRLHAKHLGQ